MLLMPFKSILNHFFIHEPEGRYMSEIDAALKILGLKPNAIKIMNVFGKRSEAEKTWESSVAQIGMDGHDINEGLQIANTERERLEAWKTLCYERMKYHICKVCSHLTKVEHHHCPECNCILQIKITWPEEDIGVERTTCQKCDYYNARVIDNPEEVAILRPDLTDTTK